MASIDFNLSPELAYCLKDNVAYPVVGASASSIATLAQTRLVDAATESSAAQTQLISAVTVANPTVVKQ